MQKKPKNPRVLGFTHSASTPPGFSPKNYTQTLPYLGLCGGGGGGGGWLVVVVVVVVMAGGGGWA